MKKAFLIFAILLALTSYHPTQAQNWNQIIKNCASDRDASDYFGYSVSISGDYAIVGAFAEDEDASGGGRINAAGSAYIFKHNAGTWTHVQKIVAADREANDWFGYSVSISGNYAIVGAPKEKEDANGENSKTEAGSVYIFRNIAGTWTQVQKIAASNREFGDLFGHSVSISGDFAIVGAHEKDGDPNKWPVITDAGSAYILRNNAGTWTEVQKIVASNRGSYYGFGYSVSISEDLAIIGAYREGQDLIGGPSKVEAGSAYIFQNNDGTWVQKQRIVASDRATYDNFGCSVSISGDYAIIGASGKDEDASGGTTLKSAGAAYMFKNNAGTWVQEQKIVAFDRDADDLFGSSVSISGNYAIVGAAAEDEDASLGTTLSSAGSAYIFKNNAGTWSQLQKIVASDRGIHDNFGKSVSISGEYAMAGAYQEDEDTNGGLTLQSAGSAYIFGRSTGINVQSNSITIMNGDATPCITDHTDFGPAIINTPATRTYTIENTGNAFLYLTGTPSVSVSGTGFSLLTDAHNSIAAGNSSTFQVTFTPTRCGYFSGTISIVNNSGDMDPYTFSIAGTGIDNIPPDIEDPVVNIPETELKGILIYPNPTSGILDFDFSDFKVIKISISDISGNVTIEKLVTHQKEIIDLSHFSNGIYIITIQTENKAFTRKIIKNK